MSLLTVATLIGLTWLVTGIIELASAFTGTARQSRPLLGILGALSVLGALVVLIWPGPSLATLVYLTGFWLVALGGVQLLVALRTRPRPN